MVAHNKYMVKDEPPDEAPATPGVYASIWAVLGTLALGTLVLAIFAAMCGALAAVAVRSYLFCMGW